MIVCGVGIILSILYWILCDAAPPGWTKGQFIKLLIITGLISLAICVYEEYGPKEEASLLLRNEAGAGSTRETRILDVDGIAEGYQFSVDLPERRLSEEEIEEAFSQAEKEIEEKFTGDNKSLEEIENTVSMQSGYVNGIISASWHISDYTYIQTDGRILNESLKEPVLLMAEVTLTYMEEERIYSFPFRIVPPTTTPMEKFYRGITEAAKANFEENSTEKKVHLPEEYEGRKLNWSKEKQHMGVKLFFLGIVVLVGLGFGRTIDEKKKSEERLRALQLEYSDIVCTLSLLLGSGMSVRKAWEKMVMSYAEGDGGRNEALEEMTITLRHMQDGMSESVAIEEFGKRCRIPCYKKMSSLLLQFMQKGVTGVREALATEVRIAFEERKSLAKIAGEQAGTKLLGPMMLQLGTTLVIIIVPALMSFTF